MGRDETDSVLKMTGIHISGMLSLGGCPSGLLTIKSRLEKTWDSAFQLDERACGEILSRNELGML